MDLAEHAERHGAFYVPAFAVKANGLSLTRDLGIGVSQVEVDLTLGGAGRFSFTVVNTFDLEKRAFVTALGRPVLEVLAFGSAIEVCVGYGDQSRLPVAIAGTVTEVTTGFAEGSAPELSVAGYDALFPFTLGKRSQSWTKVSDSDVVSQLAQQYNLQSDITPTKQKHEQVEQNQESDFEFIKKLAERNHYEFYVNERKVLRFGPPKDRDSAVVTLHWGKSLLSFKPQANLAEQVSVVEVHGWDPAKKQAIVGKATAGEASGIDAQRKSAGDRLRTALGKDAVLQVRQPVFTEAEAKKRAQAVLSEKAKKFLTGDAESLGLPDLRPDRNVTLADLGTPFSKTYYIQQTTHRVDGSGYRTRLKVKETSL